MRAIIFYTSWFLSLTSKGCVSSFPAILVLENSKVHIGILYYNNVVSYVKVSINKNFGRYIILEVLNVNPDNSHVWLWRKFDNSWFWCNVNIVKDVHGFDNCFHHTRIYRHVSTLNEVQNTKYLQVRLGLGETSILDVIRVYQINVFHIFFNHIKIWLRCYLIGYNNKAMVVRAYEVYYGIWLDPLESLVEIDIMLAWIFHKYYNVLTTHRNNDLLLGRVLGSYVDIGLRFACSIDCFVNFFNFL